MTLTVPHIVSVRLKNEGAKRHFVARNGGVGGYRLTRDATKRSRRLAVVFTDLAALKAACRWTLLVPDHANTQTHAQNPKGNAPSTR